MYPKRTIDLGDTDLTRDGIHGAIPDRGDVLIVCQTVPLAYRVKGQWHNALNFKPHDNMADVIVRVVRDHLTRLQARPP